MSQNDRTDADSAPSVTVTLADQYAGPDGDVELQTFIRQYSALPDDALAEIIEADGRHRIRLNLPVTLDRYLDAIDDLPQRRDPLDAAIDVTLRAMSRTRRGPARTDPQAVRDLIEQYPEFQQIIIDAAALNNAVWSTTTLRERVGSFSQQLARPLPCDFGPAIPDGTARYQLRRFLGSGAFGTVFLAVDRQLSDADHPALVAIKILDDPKSDQSMRGGERRAWTRQRLTEEATKARRVDHPNVVRVLDRGISDRDEDYIVYELVEGGNLDQWIDEQLIDCVHASGREPGIDPGEAARIVSSIARGVQAAHSAGLVHCDLKPSNIILTTDGEPKVADFGIAVRFKRSASGDSGAYADAGDSSDAATDRPIGNLAFISPEQFRREGGALTAPSDIYALGGILFYLLTGELPNGDSRQVVAATHDPETGRTTAPSVRDRRPIVARDLDAICRRAMAPRPEKRYSAASELADDLDAWLRHEPIRWTNPTTAHMLRLWARRRPTVAASVLLAGVAVLGGTSGVLILNHRAIEADLRADAAELAKQVEQARAETASVRAEEAQTRIRVTRELVENIYNKVLPDLERGEQESQLIPFLWSIEYLVSPSIMLSGSKVNNLQVSRTEVVEQLVSRLSDQGRASDLKALLWRCNLALWHAQHHQLERARAMLDADRPHWQRMLNPNDGMWAIINTIDAGIDARYLLQRAQQTGSVTDALRQDLQAAADRIQRHRPNLVSHSPRSPVLKYALQTLADLYDTDMLDRPGERDAAMEALQEQTEIRSLLAKPESSSS